MPNSGFRHTEKSKAAMSRSHTGKKFSATHRTNHKKAVAEANSKSSYRKRMSEVKKGVPMPLDSLVGAGVNNHQAKTWTLKNKGVEYTFKNLALFIREHKHMFAKDDVAPYPSRKDKCRAYVMIKNLYLINKKTGRPVLTSMKWKGWEAIDKKDRGE